MLLLRGLGALILGLIFSFPLEAKFLYKDEVVNNPDFEKQIQIVGEELKSKTGVSLYVVMLRDLENNVTISDYEKQISQEIDEPAVVMTFVELKKQVDILARPSALYKDFNKEQVLSPNATFVGAVVSSIMFARSFGEAKELISNSGGTVVPILAERAKGDDIVKKYSVAMFNGYCDVAEQIAASKGVSLNTSAGTGSKDFINLLRAVFYGMILYGVYLYIKRVRARKKAKTNG